MDSKNYEKIEKLGQKGKAAKLVKYAEGRDIGDRAAAAKALGNVKGEESYNTLIILLRDADKDVRLNAISSLGKIGQVSAAEHIKYVMERDSDPDVVEACRSALGSLHGMKS